MTDMEEPPKAPGAYFLWLMRNREKVKRTLPADVDKKAFAAECSETWKNLADQEKRTWKEKNDDMKRAVEAYKARGGVVSPGIRAKAKARGKARAQTAQTQSAQPDVDGNQRLASLSDDDLMAELARRLGQSRQVRPRVEASSGAESDAESSTRVPDGPASVSEAPSASEPAHRQQDPAPEFAKTPGYKHWYETKGKAKATSALGDEASRQQLQAHARKKWSAFPEEVKQKWENKAAEI
jgi:hypothetical protein